jgi:anti-sigma factor RsiW
MSQGGQEHREEHLSSEQIVAYIDQTLAEDKRSEVEGHLAECQTCLREVLDVRHLLGKCN